MDLAQVARRLMGDPPGRRGRNGKRLWWPCPFHPDRNPSFCIEPGKGFWRCFGCGEHGDAAALVMKLQRVSFPQARAFLEGDAPTTTAIVRSRPADRSRAGRTLDDADEARRQVAAVEMVERASARLWTDEGRSGLRYLRDRGLDDATIRRARLGWVSDAGMIGSDPNLRRSARFRGVVIPWWGPGGIELVKIRQPQGATLRYAEVYRRRPRTYPGPPMASLPHPDVVVVVEGELDALLLGQVLDGLATVITTGSASSRPGEATLRDVEAAYRLVIATDADEAGDRAAQAWPGRGVRVRPPEPHKDWTDAHKAGVPLRWWWLRRLSIDLDDAAPSARREIPPERLSALAGGDILRAAGLAAPLCWLPEPQVK